MGVSHLSLANLIVVLFMIGLPVLVIALGISLGLHLARGKGTRASSPDQKSNRNLYLVLGVLLLAVLLFLAFSVAIPPGQAPLPVILPILLVLTAQWALWVLIIAGAVWLVLWLARRMGVVGPARESPLDIARARYARGEISKTQFEELERDLADS